MNSESMIQLGTLFEANLSINIFEESFYMSVFYAVLSFVFWMIVPQLEYRFNLFSQCMDNDKTKVHDFFIYFLINNGAYRNLTFHNAVRANLAIDFGQYSLIIEIISLIAAILGFLLICSTYYRLGMRGIYFGDYFNFRFTERITAFPYSHFDNPQYLGTTMLFTGYSLFYHSPAGLFLSVLNLLLYKIFAIMEFYELEKFYPKTGSSENSGSIQKEDTKSLKSKSN